MTKDTPMIIFTAAIVAALAYFFNSAVFIFAVFGIIVYAVARHTDPADRKFVVAILIAGFVLRVMVAVALHAVSYLKGYGGAISGDDLLYTLKGIVILGAWKGEPAAWASSIAGSSLFGLNPLTYLLAVFYKAFGFHPLSAKFITAMIGTLMGWMSYLTARKMFDNRAARIAMAITVFYPSFIRWSVGNLKDPLLIFSFMAILYILTLFLYRKIELWKYALLVLFILVFYGFSQKFYFVLVLLAAATAIGIRLLKFISGFFQRRILTALIVLSVGVAFYYMVFVNTSFLVDFLYLCQEQQSGVAVSDYAGYMLYPRDFLTALNYGKIPLAGLFNVTLCNLIYFMLTPFPWQMTSRERLAAFPQMILWYILLVFSVFGFMRLWSSRKRIALLLGAILTIGITVNALAEGNIGAAFRHRDIFTPFFIILAAGFLSKLADDLKKRGPS